MIARLAAYDREYRRNMAVCVPLSMSLWVIAVLAVPRELLPFPTSAPVGYRGPLKIHPEVDIQDVDLDEEQTTAAPRGAPPADFTVVDFDYADVETGEPRLTPSSPGDVQVDTTPQTSEFDGAQDAPRTTSHPILGETEYELLYMERPVYPRAALDQGIEGDVEILMLVDTRGKVSQAVVVNPNRVPILERAARDAVAKSIFQVYRVNGIPTAFWVRVPVEFRIVN